MESGSPQRVLHAGVLLLTNGFFFVLMNELGSLLILFITVSLVLIASDGVKPIDLIPVGCLFASLSFLGWKALSILGTKLPHSLFGKIWNKINARFAYVNVLSKMDSLSQEETLGAAYQPIQGQKAILTSKWLGHSPYDISIPAKSSDYVTCCEFTIIFIVPSLRSGKDTPTAGKMFVAPKRFNAPPAASALAQATPITLTIPWLLLLKIKP